MKNNTFVISWHSKIEETVRPLRSIYLVKVMSRKLINDKYIESLKMGWYASNIFIRFRVGHKQTIETLLDDPNINYIVEYSDVELIKDKIQSTDTVMVV